MDYCIGCGRMLASGTSKCPLCGFKEQDKDGSSSVFDIFDDMDAAFGYDKKDTPSYGFKRHICQNDILEGTEKPSDESAIGKHSEKRHSPPKQEPPHEVIIEQRYENQPGNNEYDDIERIINTLKKHTALTAEQERKYREFLKQRYKNDTAAVEKQEKGYTVIRQITYNKPYTVKHRIESGSSYEQRLKYKLFLIISLIAVIIIISILNVVLASALTFITEIFSLWIKIL